MLCAKIFLREWINMIKLKRAYEKATPSDGYRVLVDRIWPRGIKKENAEIDNWLKAIAPSNELRKWFGHDPQRFAEFRQKYQAELQNEPAKTAFKELQQVAKNHDVVTLVYGAKDETHNQAVVLAEILKKDALE
jgi:uncharacterized protein YeaO (DUF488 family)